MPRKRRRAIRDHFEGRIAYAELTLKEKTYLKQVKMVESMWLSGKPDRTVKQALTEQYSMLDSAAYRIMNDARVIFGDLRKVDKNLLRYQADQMAREMWEIARANEDIAGMGKAIKLIIEANGLNNEDPDSADWSKVEASLNILVIPDELKAAAMKALSGGVVDLTVMPDLPESIIQDAEIIADEDE